MLVVMNAQATAAQIEGVAQRIRELGFVPQVIPGQTCTAIGVTGNEGPIDRGRLSCLPGVAQVVRVTGPYKLVARAARAERSSFPVASTRIGGGFTLIAGPCAVESERKILEIARSLTERGVRLLRGGAYKPRTSPYSFQGLGPEGLAYLAKARQETGIGIVTEALDVENVARVEEVTDVIQVGSRSMQNYPLLQRVAQARKPVLLKRGMAATPEEWLMAAEYVMSGGNEQVILCERGVRSFGDYTRNVLDLAVVPALKHLTHLPVVVDPSHATGDARYVPAMALAALAAGADGLLIELHSDPSQALSDGAQALDVDAFGALQAKLKAVAAALEVKLL
jgi:3-deoxy-7-phosphoheptulonate synthase